MAETSWTATKTGLLVPERRTIAVDLFADARGFSLGFHRAGWPRWPPPSSTPDDDFIRTGTPRTSLYRSLSYKAAL